MEHKNLGTQEAIEEAVVKAYGSYGINRHSSVFKDRLANINIYNNRLEYHREILRGKDRVEIEVPTSKQTVLERMFSSFSINRIITKALFSNITHNRYIKQETTELRGIIKQSVLKLFDNISITDGKLRYKNQRVIKGLTKDLTPEYILGHLTAFGTSRAISNYNTNKKKILEDVNKYISSNPEYTLVDSKEGIIYNKQEDKTYYLVVKKADSLFNEKWEARICPVEQWIDPKLQKEAIEDGILSFKQWQLNNDPSIAFKYFNTPSAKEQVKVIINSVLEQIAKANLALVEKVIISARPDDFILCSENTTGWRSCFAIDGEYHASTNAFYMEPRFLISFTLDSNGVKVGRRWLWVDKDNMVVCSGLEYGSYSNITKVRHHIQQILTEARGLEWSKDDWYGHSSGESYGDAHAIYEDECYRVSWHKNFDSEHQPENFCSIYKDVPDGLDYFDDVAEGYWNEDKVSCDDCGDRYSEDAMQRDYNGNLICPDCLESNYFWCEGYDAYFNEYNYNSYYIGSCVYSEEYCSNSDDIVWQEDTDTYGYLDDSVYLGDTEVWVSEDYNARFCDELGEYVSHEYEMKEEEDES